MTGFKALLRLQLLSRFADFKPKNLKTALKEKKGRTIGMFIAILFLVVYLGVIDHGTLRAQGTLEELRSGEKGASLEDLFLQLTDDGGEEA